MMQFHHKQFKLLPLLLFTLSTSVYATVSSGPYVGIELGTDNQIINFQSSAFGLNTSNSQLYNPSWGFMGRLNFGYNFDKYNGIELSPNYLFSTNYNYPNNNGSMSIDATTLDLSYLAYLPITQSKLSVFGRIGFAYNWINNSGSNTTGCNCGNSAQFSSPTGSNFADVIGAGLKYNLGTNSSVRIEWIANGLFFPIGLTSNSTNVANWTAQTFLAGLNYHF